MAIRIFFDGECPFCSSYVRLLNLRAAHGEPQLIDLRQNPKELKILRSSGFDLDKGMIVFVDDRWYFGDRAVHVLAALSTSSTAFNKINRILFSLPYLARWIYPILRMGRNILLFVLGRKRLEMEQVEDLASFALFNAAWGLFAVFHAISYCFFSYGSNVKFSTVLIGFLGAALLLRPYSMRLFTGLILTMMLDALLQPPLLSNHTIIKNFVLLAMAAAGTRQLWLGGRWTDFYADFAPIGRMLLVTMYIFGIFHKLNWDFLNPEVSCAVALWRAMPLPLSYFDSAAMHYLTIYGTFFIEGLILLLLLMRRSRHLGVALGITFHALLALSDYAMYVQFSMLAVALHMLFLERHDALAFQSSALWLHAGKKFHTRRGYGLFCGWLLLVIFLVWNGGYTEVAVVWMPIVLLFAWLCLTVRHNASEVGAASLLCSPALLLNLFSIFFFLNCAAPYFGLKTSQSINMFANLQLEGGRSNHLIFFRPPGPFNYLADIVSVKKSSGSALFSYAESTGLKLTYYQLLDEIERHPDFLVSFERNGVFLANQNARSLDADIKSILHPRWIRYWFHFNVVDLSSPKRCAIDR